MCMLCNTARSLGALASLLLLASIVSADPVAYNVNINSTAISGTSGSFEFNFSPGPGVAQSASLQIVNFSSDGSIVGAPQLTGDVGGGLPGTLTFDNGTDFNDYFDGFTYGAHLSFTVLLFGPALSAPDGTSNSGSEFALSLYSDPAGTMSILSNNPVDPFAFTIDVNLDGSTTVANYSSQTTLTPSGVPEPGTLVLLGVSFVFVVCWRLLRRLGVCLR